MTTHELKTWPGPFNAVAGGKKTFEWRRNDRAYAQGDTLVLREWDPKRSAYTGRYVMVRVGYILRGPEFGVPEGWAVLSIIKPPSPPKPQKAPRAKAKRNPRVPAPTKTPRKKVSRPWVSLTSGGLPSLGKRR